MKKLILPLAIVLFFIIFSSIALAQYCQTIVNVGASPNSINAGNSITISGNVYSSGSCNPDPPVQIYLDDGYIGTVNTDYQGYYTFTYATSNSISTGSHVVKAVSKVNCCAQGYNTAVFTVNAKCNAQYLDEWQCSNSWRQRKYQESDCTYVWQNYEYCNNGCSGGSCITQSCTPQYLSNYQCSGNWKQQQYMSDECTVSWTNVEYCNYGCSGGMCQPSCNSRSCGYYHDCDYYNGCDYYHGCDQYHDCGHYQSECSVSASVTTPSDSYVDHVVSTIVTFTNNGDSGGYVSFNVFMCNNYDDCQSMICEDNYYRVYSNDGRVYVDGRESRSITCTLTPTQSCNHRIKVEYYGCTSNYDPTIYSGYFKVSNRHPCTAQYLGNYECLGNSRRQQYQDSYCSTTWKTIEVCENGCSNGECVSGSTTTTIPAGEGSPLVSVRQDYSVNKCEINSFSFDVMNVGPSSATFSISASGSAADWIRLESPITLEKNEKRSVTAYASVPCGAKGEYDFTVTASGKTSSSATSYLKINEPASTFVFPALRLSPEWLIVLLIVILLIVLLLILFLVLNRRRGCKRGIFYRRCGAESF